ncbi:MAG: arsenite methyltransferase, partial [Acidimicrobiales bacterium]
MTEPSDIRETVRRRYAEAATRFGGGDHAGAQSLDVSCCGPATVATTDVEGRAVFGAALYDEVGDDAGGALSASLGCGVPTAVADLQAGETVLDLGSGAGGDVLLSARRVGPTGKVIGLDMTTEMVELARANAASAGVTNVEFRLGYLEDIPLPDASTDVVISNCVINLAVDKGIVLAEAARVLRPGGRLAISDVVADADMDAETRADMAAWTGCVAGALTQEQFRRVLGEAGFSQVEITET